MYWLKAACGTDDFNSRNFPVLQTQNLPLVSLGDVADYRTDTLTGTEVNIKLED
jgi:hypothetical protein